MPDDDSTTAIAPRPRGNPTWVRGGPSPNPGGGPKSHVAKLRRALTAIDPDLSKISAAAYTMALDVHERPRERVLAMQLILAYLVGRPEVAVKVSTGDGSGMTVGFLASVDVLPDDKLRELAAMGLGADVLDAESVEHADDDER